MADHDEDLVPSEESGYKPPKQATLDEMKSKDADDESLNKWKASLIKAEAAKGPADDPRRVVVLSLALEVQGREDVVLELDTPEKVEKAKKYNFTIKEGVDYRLKVKFLVQHDIVTGLKYLQAVKRAGISVDKTEEMIGSYAPQPEPHSKTFQTEQAPSGMMVRGHYSVKSKFIDDDKNTHLAWEWGFDIKKDWD